MGGAGRRGRCAGVPGRPAWGDPIPTVRCTTTFPLCEGERLSGGGGPPSGRVGGRCSVGGYAPVPGCGSNTTSGNTGSVVRVDGGLKLADGRVSDTRRWVPFRMV
jgi:hypothetical protein